MKTIQEMKEAKSKLEEELLVLVSKFEEDYGVNVYELKYDKCAAWATRGLLFSINKIKVKVEL